jgi:hypothetical protein
MLTPRRQLYRGWAGLQRGQTARALRAWRRGLKACAVAPSPYDELRLHLLLARHGAGEQAAAHTGEARRLAQACGMAGPPYPLMPGG